MWNDVIHLFQGYMGTGLIVIWFLVSIVYLFLTEKRKHIRILFVYVPILLLLLFFNPLFTKLVYVAAGDEIYYRILWLMPITIVIAFAVVTIWSTLQGRKKTVFGLSAAVVVMISGSYIYNNPYFHKAENLYHVPQSVVEICDAIEVEGREVMAVFPVELVQYVRQYSPVVRMPYGREMLVGTWGEIEHELYDVMEAEEIDAEKLASLCRDNICAYIILPEDKKVNGDLTEFDYEWFGQVQNYIIYKDATVDLTIHLK